MVWKCIQRLGDDGRRGEKVDQTATIYEGFPPHLIEQFLLPLDQGRRGLYDFLVEVAQLWVYDTEYIDVRYGPVLLKTVQKAMLYFKEPLSQVYNKAFLKYES